MKTLLGTIAALALAGTAQAGITFSFADPGATSGELSHSQATGQITYNSNVALTFVVDLTSIGGAVVQFTNARLELNLSVGAANQVGPNDYLASISDGSFRVFNADNGQNILLASVLSGNLFTFQPGGQIVSTTALGLSYTAGSELQNLLTALNPGYVIAAPSDGAFTLTDLTTSGPLVSNNEFNDFRANSSFSGTTEVVPTPGALAAVGMGLGLAGLRRRR